MRKYFVGSVVSRIVVDGGLLLALLATSSWLVWR